MSKLTNRERFLAGQKFTYEGEEDTIFRPFKMSESAPPRSLFKNSLFRRGEFDNYMGNVQSYTKDGVELFYYLFKKVVKYRLSFAKMTFIDSEAGE